MKQSFSMGGYFMTGHSLKRKMLTVYTILILLMFGVSLMFVYSLSSISRTINGIMQANYKSIRAAQDMMEALDEGRGAILTYIINDEDAGLKQFIKGNQNFTSAFVIEKSNITEKGEADIVEKINTSYANFYNDFANLQNYKKNYSPEQAIMYYNSTVIKQYNEAKDNCKTLIELNQKAMFLGKNKASDIIKSSISMNLIISFIILVSGFALIAYVLSGIFKPIRELTNHVAAIKEGNLYHKIDIKTSDEIGQLALEFNNMTKRLQNYDQMNIKKLIDEKNKSTAIVNSISDPVIVTDAAFKIVLINPAAEDLFAITHESATSRHFLEVIDNKQIYNSIAQVIKNTDKNSSKVEDILVVKTNDKERYYKITAAPIFDKDKVIINVVAVLQDITHLKEVENLKSEFVSTVSHEFRTPLTSISLGVGLLLDGTLGEINSGQKEIITAIRDEEVRLANLVSDLLDLSRIEAGKISVNMKPVQIESIIDGTVRMMLEQAKNKNISLCYYNYVKLPKVMADADKIKEVLVNLIGNSLKFTPDNGKIEVYSNFRDDKIFISVKDNGIGIPREYHEKIFEKFVQVKKDINDGSGTGLGLAIVKKIVEIHGGEIWVESEEGKGSTFTFTLKCVI
jgi:NtrC-family two-component system sensor histidine kinase KinB